MTNYHFICGDAVYLTREWTSSTPSHTIYEVMALLPSEGSSPRYRVKAAGESFSRVALEHTMTAVLSPEPTHVVLAFPAEMSRAFVGPEISGEPPVQRLAAGAH